MYNSGVKKIVSGVLALFLIAAVLILGDTVYSSMFGGETQPTAQTVPMQTVPTAPTVPAQPVAPATVPTQTTTAAPATQAPTDAPSDVPATDAPESTTAAPSADVGSMSKDEVVAFLGEAVNKTKGYTENLSAKHTESFDANVTNCTGGSTVAGIVNSVMSGIVKPTDETLTYSAGSAVNSEGETVQILLPKAGAFSLNPAGAESAVAAKDGDNTVVDIKLVQETSGLGQAPQYASTCVGFLDLSDISVPGVTINRADTTYNGVTIHAVVRPDGYVSSVTYVTPVHLELEAKALVATATATIEATETESFEIMW